jgi:small subunit ribosomal protein S8
MGMTDPIADLLTRIRNGQLARHEKVTLPWSRMKEAVVRALASEGYVRDIVVGGEATKRTLTVLLAYTDSGEPVINGVRRVSKPGLRVYASVRHIPSVRNGYGVSVLSTPAGLLADREARRRNVGGEVVCEVW